MATSTLTKAKQNKADEFYMQLPDIEAEMRHYRDQFKGKSVLCNCDDPYESNFFKYFKPFGLDGMEADHATPWIEGGRTHTANCQMLCRDCNRRKGAR
jgi:5-methylcytosine-specific restriction endonuclease McrA